MKMYRRIGAILVAAFCILGVVTGPAHAGSGAPAVRAAFGTPYYIQFAHSGKCLDNPNFSTSSGTQMDQWDCVKQTNELWAFDEVGSGVYRIFNWANGLCLNVYNNAYQNGTKIIQWTCGNYANEEFILFNDGTGRTIRPYVNENFALNISGASTANGAKLILWTAGSYSNEYVTLN